MNGNPAYGTDDVLFYALKLFYNARTTLRYENPMASAMPFSGSGLLTRNNQHINDHTIIHPLNGIMFANARSNVGAVSLVVTHRMTLKKGHNIVYK